MEYPIKNLFLGDRSSSILMIWPAHPSLLFEYCLQYLDICINYKLHYSIQYASIL
jgi:hypothetical protein